MYGPLTIAQINREAVEAHEIMKQHGHNLPGMPKGEAGKEVHYSLAELAAQREAAERVAKAVVARA